MNGVKPWIVSKEDEQTNMTCLNSMRLFQNCNPALVINGTRERVVMDQIITALKIVTDRMSARSRDEHDKDYDNNGQLQVRNKKNYMRNVVVFTGTAIQEIMRDLTMQKAFMTLAYISDMLVGSEISPVQKQKLLKIAKAYVGEGEYTAAIVTTPED